MGLLFRLASLTLLVCVVVPVKAQDPAPVTANSDTPKPTRISIGGNVAAAKLTHVVHPVYPPLARQTRISGTVRLHAVISKDGKVLSLDVVSGHPLLLQAALDAVHQWTYQPTLLNGEPVEVDTAIDVIFALQDNPASDGASPNPSPNVTGGKIDFNKSEDPQLRADVLRLLDAMHFKENSVKSSRQVFESLRPALLASIPATSNRERITDAYIDKLIALIQSDSYRERVIAIYEKYLSDADIQGLTAFYETPAGQHFNMVMPQLVGEMNQLGQSMAMDNLPSIFKELCKEFPELEDDAHFCKEPDPQRKSQVSSPYAVRPSGP